MKMRSSSGYLLICTHEEAYVCTCLCFVTGRRIQNCCLSENSDKKRKEKEKGRKEKTHARSLSLREGETNRRKMGKSSTEKQRSAALPKLDSQRRADVEENLRKRSVSKTGLQESHQRSSDSITGAPRRATARKQRRQIQKEPGS